MIENFNSQQRDFMKANMLKGASHAVAFAGKIVESNHICLGSGRRVGRGNWDDLGINLTLEQSKSGFENNLPG